MLALIAAACGSGATAGPESTATPEPESTTTEADVAPAATAPIATSNESEMCFSEGEPWEVAKIYIEHNATDADTGIHGVFGGEPWREICVLDPTGSQIWLVDPLGALGALGGSEYFFESNEPPNDEYSIDDLKRDFPEGDYAVSGTDHEGIVRVGAATLTHTIPAEPSPQITSPSLHEQPEAITSTRPVDSMVVEWEPVTETIDGEPVTLSGYEVIVTMEDFNDPHGQSLPVYGVHVGPDVTSLAVVDGWLLPGTVYELEVIAIEEFGNQTIGLGFFRTEG